MRTAFVTAALAAAAITGAGAILAAPAQDRPGQISQARVFVENHGRGEAVPVIVHEVATPGPIAVQVTGTPAVSIVPATVVQTRAVRQQWEYRTLDVAREPDAAAALSKAGADGWETTGLQLSDRAGAPIVLKRPR